MNDIQMARDVLARWRKAARDGEWSIEADTAESSLLGRGTAGNPDLIDAIDGLLAQAQHQVEDVVDNPDEVAHARRIAAAIIAADNRMQQ